MTTARERAERSLTDARLRCDRHPRLVDAIAAAIEGAEAEAYERAAREVESGWVLVPWALSWTLKRKELAKLVRALASASAQTPDNDLARKLVARHNAGGSGATLTNRPIPKGMIGIQEGAPAAFPRGDGEDT